MEWACTIIGFTQPGSLKDSYGKFTSTDSQTAHLHSHQRLHWYGLVHTSSLAATPAARPEQLMDIPTGGSAEYIAMAQHGTNGWTSPVSAIGFLCRLVVSVLPVPAELGFRIVTFTCLGSYVHSGAFHCRGTGHFVARRIDRTVVVCFAHEPTRSTTGTRCWPMAGRLLASFIMVWALIRGRDVIFTVASVLGTLGRESVMFLTPGNLHTGQVETGGVADLPAQIRWPTPLDASAAAHS